MSTTRTEPPPPDGGLRYQIITVAYHSREPLSQLLARLPEAIPVLVVDNSREAQDLSDLIAARPNTRYLDSGGNVGFGAACNLGARAATHPVLIFLNPDTEPDPALFQQLVEQLEQDPRCSSCGPALAEEDGAVQRGAGGWQPTLRRALVHAAGLDRLVSVRGIWFLHGHTPVEVEWLAGTCLAIRRDVFLEVGGFDPHYFLYQEDMELGWRLHRSGYRQVLRADLRLKHALGGSTPTSYSRRVWQLRAQMMVEYLHAHAAPLQARLLRGVLAAGYLGRGAVYRAAGQPLRAAEMLHYTRVLLRPASGGTT